MKNNTTNNLPETYGNKEVFFAYLDILGFKDIVKYNENEYLTRIYVDLLDSIVQQGITFGTNDLNGTRVNALTVSDSIMLWTNHDNGWGIVELTEVVRIILKECMKQGLPLRGYITRGSAIFQRTSLEDLSSFDVGRITLAGKALVAAYEEEGKYSWSGCVISKECIDTWEKHPSNHYLETARRSKVIVDYCTPYKTAQDNFVLKQVTALNWSWGNGITRQLVVEAFKKHNKKLDKDRAKQIFENTLKFFDDMQ